jgi:uncharacterized OB-fold protein
MTRCSKDGCPREPMPGFKLCAKHREYLRTYQAARRQRRIEAGDCTKCPARSLSDSEFCAACREEHNAYRRRAA